MRSVFKPILIEIYSICCKLLIFNRNTIVIKHKLASFSECAVAVVGVDGEVGDGGVLYAVNKIYRSIRRHNYAAARCNIEDSVRCSGHTCGTSDFNQSILRYCKVYLAG